MLLQCCAMVLKGETPFFNEGYIKTVAAVGGVEAVEKGNFSLPGGGKRGLFGMGTDCEKNGETAFCLKEGRGMGGKALVENISFVENLPWHSIYSRVFFRLF